MSPAFSSNAFNVASASDKSQAIVTHSVPFFASSFFKASKCDWVLETATTDAPSLRRVDGCSVEITFLTYTKTAGELKRGNQLRCKKKDTSITKVGVNSNLTLPPAHDKFSSQLLACEFTKTLTPTTNKSPSLIDVVFL